MKIATDFRTGKPTPKTWSGVLGYRPESKAKVDIFGEMFGVMSIDSEVPFDFPSLGGLLFDELQDAYFQQYKTEVSFSDFKQAMYKLRERLDEILSREDELVQSGIDLELAIAVIKGDVLYLAVVGESKVYIQREEETADISKSLVDSDQEGFVRTGSLLMAEGDRIMLLTSKVKELQVEGKYEMVLRNLKYDRDKLFTGASIILGYGLDLPEPEPVLEPELAAVPAAGMVSALAATGEAVVSADPFAVDEEKAGLGMEGNDIGEENIDPAAEVVKAYEHEQDLPEPVVSESELLPASAPVTAEVGAAVGTASTQAMIAANMQKYAQKYARIGKEQAVKLAGSAKTKAQQIIEQRRQRGAQAQPEPLDAGAAYNIHANLEPRGSAPYPEAQDRGMPAGQDSGYVYTPRRPTPTGSKVIDAVRNVVYKVQMALRPLVSNIVHAVNSRSGGAQMYLRQRGPNRNWRVLILVGVVIVVSLVFGLQKLAEDREREAHVLAIETSVTDLAGRMEVLDLEVATVTISKGRENERSRVLNKLNELLSDAELLRGEGIRADEVERVITQANKAKDQLQNIRAFTDPLVIADLGISFGDTKPTDLTFSDGKIFVVDEGRGVIYRLNTTANSEPGVFVDNLDRPYLLDTDEKGNLVFIDRNSDSVVGTVNKDTGEVTRHAGLSSTQMGEVTDFDVWSNAAMYSINKARQAIIKQDNFGSGYQLPNTSTPWRSDSNLGRAVDIEVDYWIYVMHTGQGLQRYLAGEPDEFELAGLISEDRNAIRQATAFDITDTHLYIADPANRRVLVFIKRVDDNKVMDFVAQYVYRGEGNVFANIKEVYANPATNQLFVLDGSRVVRLDL